MIVDQPSTRARESTWSNGNSRNSVRLQEKSYGDGSFLSIIHDVDANWLGPGFIGDGTGTLIETIAAADIGVTWCSKQSAHPIIARH